MKIFNKKQILSMMLAVLLAPAVVSAGVYFIDKEDTPAGAGELVKPCFLDYPLITCPSDKIPQNICPSDNRFFKNCACEEKYKWNSSNCTANQILSGNICDGKYENCDCKTEFNKTCTGNNIGVGDECDGKYKSCCDDSCANGYTKTKPGTGACFDTAATACGTACYKEKPCCDDTCKSGSKSVSCGSNQYASKLSSTECGSSCYQCCGTGGQICSAVQSCGGWDSCGNCNLCIAFGYIRYYFAEDTQNLRCELSSLFNNPSYPGTAYFAYGDVRVYCNTSRQGGTFHKDLGFYQAKSNTYYDTKEKCEAVINNGNFPAILRVGSVAGPYYWGNDCDPY